MKDWLQGTVFVKKINSSVLAMVNLSALLAVWHVKKPVRYMSLIFSRERCGPEMQVRESLAC